MDDGNLRATEPAHRIALLDVLRTIAIVLMVTYHAAFDLSYWHGWAIDMRGIVWQAIGRSSAVLFLLLVGVSFAVSARRKTPKQIQWHTFRRCAVILSWAMTISIVTYVMAPETSIRFGILHCIGVSLLILLATRKLGAWNVLLGSLWIAMGTAERQTTAGNELLLPLGIVPQGFTTLDYYPLLPWTGVILLGAGIGTLFLEPLCRLAHPQAAWTRRLTWPGRHALSLYLLHQPILLGVLALVAR